MQDGPQTSSPVYRVRCQIFQAGHCVVDYSFEVGVGEERSIAAPDFVAKITVNGSSGGVISLTAGLESGYRYVTPDLEILDGGTSVLGFYGTTSEITVKQIDAN